MVLYQMGEHLIALDKHNLSHHQIVIWIVSDSVHMFVKLNQNYQKY